MFLSKPNFALLKAVLIAGYAHLWEAPLQGPIGPQMKTMQSFKTLALLSETGSTCCRKVDCRAVIVSPGLADAAALLAPLPFAAFRALSKISGALRFCLTSASIVRLCAVRPRPGRAASPPRLPAMTHCKASFAIRLQYRAQILIDVKRRGENAA